MEKVSRLLKHVLEKLEKSGVLETYIQSAEVLEWWEATKKREEYVESLRSPLTEVKTGGTINV